MIVFLSLLAVCSGGYFVPTLVAYCREHQSAGAIFFLNLLLGWTIIFWVISLLWACGQVRSYEYRYAAA